jgi:hypothetical protein
MKRALILVAVVLGASLSPTAASAFCHRAQHALIDHGTSPGGVPWVIKAGIRNGINCDQSPELVTDFNLGKPEDPYWSWESVGGIHISEQFPIDAQAVQEADPYEGFLSGYLGGKVATLVARMSTGESVTIHPERPRPKLRKRYFWLRDIRFFFYFHPTDRVATVVTLYDAKGRVIYKVNSDGGLFY